VLSPRRSATPPWKCASCSPRLAAVCRLFVVSCVIVYVCVVRRGGEREAGMEGRSRLHSQFFVVFLYKGVVTSFRDEGFGFIKVMFWFVRLGPLGY
jgi:hypothetical protein